jgi:hypothetical protein
MLRKFTYISALTQSPAECDFARFGHDYSGGLPIDKIGGPKPAVAPDKAVAELGAR